MLVAVEEAAAEARERGEGSERDDEAEESALADHDRISFRERCARARLRSWVSSRFLDDHPARCRPPNGGVRLDRG